MLLNRNIALGSLLAGLGFWAVFVGKGQTLTSEGRPYRAYLGSTARDGLPASTAPPPGPARSLPGLPPGWPNRFRLGQSNAPGGAVATATRGLLFRYQYLAGGVNTGNGWASWEPAGSFVTHYISESAAAGLIPVFSYYMARQSLPGAGQPEVEGVETNLLSPTTMRALFDDLRTFFQHAAASGAPLVILHFEPDLWGYIQQKSTSDNAATFSMPVGSTGQPDVSDLPDNASGFARAILRLRDLYGPNTLVGYHLSTWGTGTDPLYGDPSPAELERLASRSASFYASLGALFDVTFAEMSDRDAGFKQYIYGDGGASWWDEGDFARYSSYLGHFVEQTGLRVVLWQVPQGNTLMRAMNNTWNHYQDNKVEWLLGDAEFTRLKPYVEAGVWWRCCSDVALTGRRAPARLLATA